jgi:hypothetical protein
LSTFDVAPAPEVCANGVAANDAGKGVSYKMTNNQKLVAELTKHVERLGDAILRAGLIDERDLDAIDKAHELLTDLTAAMS